jgi:hypothetical protein
MKVTLKVKYKKAIAFIKLIKIKLIDKKQKVIFCFQYIETKSNGEVVGTHATPVKRYIDNLSFDFDGNGGTCKVEVNNNKQFVN